MANIHDLESLIPSPDQIRILNAYRDKVSEDASDRIKLDTFNIHIIHHTFFRILEGQKLVFMFNEGKFFIKRPDRLRVFNDLMLEALLNLNENYGLYDDGLFGVGS